MFTQLRTRLTVLYVALFGAVLLLVSSGVYLAISQAAQRQVRAELVASGTVFDRLWVMRSERLREGANLLSRDFGFREAVATGESATIISAMENLKHRFGIDLAFIVTSDGRMLGSDGQSLTHEAGRITAALDSADDPSGVVLLGGQPYQVMASPVLSPEQIGWLVFAVRLDRGEMGALERLSAIPLKATVLHRQASGWRLGGATSATDNADLSRFIDRSLTQGRGAPGTLAEPSGSVLALVKRLPGLTRDAPTVLLLRYPLNLAMAPYRLLLWIVALAGLGGLIVVGWGSWMLARGITRPISALGEAAHRLEQGEDAQVSIETEDEIGRLAGSFNAMATEIRDR